MTLFCIAFLDSFCDLRVSYKYDSMGNTIFSRGSFIPKAQFVVTLNYLLKKKKVVCMRYYSELTLRLTKFVRYHFISFP